MLVCGPSKKGPRELVHHDPRKLCRHWEAVFGIVVGRWTTFFFVSVNIKVRNFAGQTVASVFLFSFPQPARGSATTLFIVYTAAPGVPCDSSRRFTFISHFVSYAWQALDSPAAIVQFVYVYILLLSIEFKPKNDAVATNKE